MAEDIDSPPVTAGSVWEVHMGLFIVVIILVAICIIVVIIGLLCLKCRRNDEEDRVRMRKM